MSKLINTYCKRNPLVVNMLSKLSDEASDPLCAYIYDLKALANHARYMVDALPINCELFYAAKANAESPILQTLKPIVHGYEAASGGELNWLREQLPDEKLIFGGPGKLDNELRQAILYGAELIHVESLFELQRLQNIADQMDVKVDVLLRMNIPVGEVESTKLAMGGKPTPFGLDESQLNDALGIIKSSPRICMKGFHFHLMSHQLCSENHLQLMAVYFDTFNRWRREYRLPVTHLNVGGGIGVNYLNVGETFDWESFCYSLNKLIINKSMLDVSIRFECGRYVSAACGYYCMEVLDIKRSYGEYFIVAKGGTHHFRTPAAQNHSHPFTIYPANKIRNNVPSLKDSTATIVGQLCTPKDILAKQQEIQQVSVGDYIVFNLAGAYAWNISHQNFLMHDKPAFIYCD